MSKQITLGSLLTNLKPLSQDNYRIEKNKPAEAATYEKLKTADVDHNGYIDVKEFRDYFIPSLHEQTVGINISDETCQDVDTVLNATETTDPKTLETAYTHLLEITEDTTYREILLSIALDKSQPHLRQYFSAMTLYNQGIGEDDWDNVLGNMLFPNTKDSAEPAGALYALDFTYFTRKYFSSYNADFPGCATTILTAIQSPAIYNNPLYMRKALRTLCILDKSAGSAKVISYCLEQLNKEIPPYKNLADLLVDSLYGLKEQALPLISQLYRLTTDEMFHRLLCQTAVDLALVYDTPTAMPLAREIEKSTTEPVTLGTMLQVLRLLGGNNLIIEKAVWQEKNAYDRLQALDTNTDNTIDVLEFRNYYLKQLSVQTQPETLTDAACIKLMDLTADTPATVKLTSSSANFESYLGLSPFDPAYRDFLTLVMLDETRAPIIRLLALEDICQNEGLNETYWEENIAPVLNTFLDNEADPVQFVLSNYYWMITRGNFPNNAADYIETFQRLLTYPKVKNNTEVKLKAQALVDAAIESSKKK